MGRKEPLKSGTGSSPLRPVDVDFPADSSEDVGGCILSRYIENLPDPSEHCRVTRSRKVARRIEQTLNSSIQFPVKVLASSFDQMSTSDYSSSNSNTSHTAASLHSCREERKARHQQPEGEPMVPWSPTSDLDVNSESSGQLIVTPDPSTTSAASSSHYCDAGWDSDTQHDQSWEEDADSRFFSDLLEKSKGRLLVEGDVRLLVPSDGPAVQLSILPDPELRPRQSLRVHHVSQVIDITPHNEQLPSCRPAFLFIPLTVEPEDPAWLECLYATSPAGEVPHWRPVRSSSYRYRSGHLVLQTCSFAMYTVIYKEPLPEVRKRIRRRIGGSLCAPSHPGIKISFPRGSCDMDIEASIRILYDNEPLDPAQGCVRIEEVKGSLASPIIMVGPHGYKFNTNRKPVEIEMPVPHYRDILQRFPHAKLSIWQSSTWDGEPLDWEQVEVERLSIHHYRCGLISISFPTFHFSFFKVVWDILTSSLYEAKMGVSYFYPWISFPMKCQAYMEENPDNKTFGLEVICFNAQTNPGQIQTSNYRYCVGSSLKPKLVRPGRIMIKLRSGKFRADVSAGEEETMEKEEPDFRGRDFEKQFACIFNESITVDRGTFGKVVVDRIGADKQKQENLFEFNLQKSGIEKEQLMGDTSDRWSIVAVKELAGTLALTDEANWKHFASYIGFTNQEIKTQLKHSADPFLTMMNLYKNRGGTPEEFVQALYSVSRPLNPGSSSASPKSGGTPGSSSGISGSGSQRSQDSANHLAKTFSFFGLNPWKNSEDSDSGTADMNMLDGSPSHSKTGRKRNRDKSSPELETGSQDMKRRKLENGGRTTSSLAVVGIGGRLKSSAKAFRTAAADTKKAAKGGDDEMDSQSLSSSDDESGAEDGGKLTSGRAKSISTERHKRNPHKLTDHELWHVSAHMSAINWRALGRTLGLEESVLLNLEHAHKGAGVRECAYQTLLEWKGMKPKVCTFGSLYSALMEEKMVGVAKHMASMLTQGSIQMHND